MWNASGQRARRNFLNRIDVGRAPLGACGKSSNSMPWLAGIEKWVYPHLFRHQSITYLTKQGIISPKLQLLSGHTTAQSLGLYRELALSDVVEEYELAMKTFPVR
jgi:site-specific recombinase XerD